MAEPDTVGVTGRAGRLVRRAMHVYWRFARPMTLGVRAAILHPEQGVFLVRHGYTPGWHMPGGGVEAGETLIEALAREVAEEAAIELDGEPALHGVFFNPGASRRDHVAVFVVRAFRQTGERRPDREIAECGFFPLEALPPGTTGPTRARLEEILAGKPAATRW